MNLSSWIEESPKTEPQKLTTVKNELPWSEKYRPDCIDGIIGNPAAIQEAIAWGKQWETKPPKKKGLLIYGNVGTGKTCLANALCEHFGWEVLEMNASDKRSQEVIETIAGIGSQTRTLSGGRRAVVVEEIEGLSGVADRGASTALAKVIKEANAPLILTCNDIENKKLSGLKVYCEQVQLKRMAPGHIVKRLKDILDKEGIAVEDIIALQKIADNSDGDLRSAINDLQALAQGETSINAKSVFLEQRDRPIDVYKALQRIFKCNDYSECRKIIWDLDEEPRNFIAWLDENIPVEYQTVSERAKAFGQLSRADVFLGRVTNRQYWGFLRYVNDLMTVGICFSKEKQNFALNRYNFPSIIWKMGSTRSKRAKEGTIAAKVSPIVHDSKRQIISGYLPLVKRVYDKNPKLGAEMISKFDLNPEEMELFL